jgi:hypothetical protein
LTHTQKFLGVASKNTHPECRTPPSRQAGNVGKRAGRNTPLSGAYRSCIRPDQPSGPEHHSHHPLPAEAPRHQHSRRCRKIKQRRTTLRPLPCTTTTCHATNGCCARAGRTVCHGLHTGRHDCNCCHQAHPHTCLHTAHHLIRSVGNTAQRHTCHQATERAQCIVCHAPAATAQCHHCLPHQRRQGHHRKPHRPPPTPAQRQRASLPSTAAKAPGWCDQRVLPGARVCPRPLGDFTHALDDFTHHSTSAELPP